MKKVVIGMSGGVYSSVSKDWSGEFF